MIALMPMGVLLLQTHMDGTDKHVPFLHSYHYYVLYNDCVCNSKLEATGTQRRTRHGIIIIIHHVSGRFTL